MVVGASIARPRRRWAISIKIRASNLHKYRSQIQTHFSHKSVFQPTNLLPIRRASNARPYRGSAVQTHLSEGYSVPQKNNKALLLQERDARSTCHPDGGLGTSPMRNARKGHVVPFSMCFDGRNPAVARRMPQGTPSVPTSQDLCAPAQFCTQSSLM